MYIHMYISFSNIYSAYMYVSVQFSCSVVSDCDPMNQSTPASLSITNSQSRPKPMSIESVMPSNHSHPLSSPSPALNLSQHQDLFK